MSFRACHLAFLLFFQDYQYFIALDICQNTCSIIFVNTVRRQKGFTETTIAVCYVFTENVLLCWSYVYQHPPPPNNLWLIIQRLRRNFASLIVYLKSRQWIGYTEKRTIFLSQLVFAAKKIKQACVVSPGSGIGNRRTTAASQAAAPRRRPEPGAKRWLRPRTGPRGGGPPRRPRSQTGPCGYPTHSPRCGPQEGAASSLPPRSRTPPLSPPRLNRHRPSPRPNRTSWAGRGTDKERGGSV